MVYSWLLFDADNTLFDFDKAEVTALAQTFQAFNLDYQPRYGETYRTINQEVWEAFERGEIKSDALRTTRFQRLFSHIGIEADPHLFSEEYLHHLAECGDLLPGVYETIQALSQSYRLALITNGLADVQRPRLAASPLSVFFEAVTISDEIGFAKPDRQIFEIAFARMEFPPLSSVLMIGDSLTSDMQGGLNFGLDTCWFNPKQKQAANGMPITYEIQAIDELLTFL